FPPPPVAAGWTTAGDSTGRDETAPAGYLIAAGQQKRKGITPHTLVPRPLLLSVLALRGWRLCRLSPAPRGKSHPNQGAAEAWNRPRNKRRAKPEPPSLELRPRERRSYQGASGGPDSAANSGRDGPIPPAGWLS